MKSKTGVLLGRLMRNIMRSPDTIITVAITPIMMMLLFVYVFGGAIQTGTDNYVNYLLPGILLMAIASGVAYTSVRLFTDVKSGLMARFITMPIKRSSILWAHVLTSCCECSYYRSGYSCCALNGFPFQCEYSRLAWSSWDTRDVYVSTNMVGYHSRADGKVYGRGDSLLVPTRFSSIY